MKKILFIGTAVAIAMGFSSCQKENVTEGQASGRLITETFSAGFEQTATKTATTDGGATVTWSANDKIYYYSKDGGEVRNYTIPNAGASASLTLERGEGDTYYNLVYAGNAEPDFTTRTDALMVFVGVKSEQDGTFQSANISVGRTTPGSCGVTFKPVTALVKFTTARTDIQTIVLTGGNGERVAGSISVDPTASSPVATLIGTGVNSITVTIATPAAGTYYINVLPGTYANGLKLTLKNTSGAEIGTVTASNSTDLSAGNSMINYGDIDSHIIPTYTEGSYSGPAIRIGDIWWAPVNCGYDATNYKYGKLYQWGRKTGGGYNDGSTYTEDLIQNKYPTQNVSVDGSSVMEAYNEFYWGSSLPNGDWLATQDDTRWNTGTESAPVKNTSYDPCPEGWRVPTWSELNSLIGSATGTGRNIKTDIHGSALDIQGLYYDGSADADPQAGIFLPAAGCRKYNDASCSGRTTVCKYWTSTPDSEKAKCLSSSNPIQYPNAERAFGCSVRCVKE